MAVKARHPQGVVHAELPFCSLDNVAAFGQSALSVSVDDVMIRDAVVADARAMGHLHVRAWQSAYRGVMPDEYLDRLVAEERVEMWHSRLSRSDLHPLLVAVVAGEVVGFAAFGAEQAPTAPPSCGELYAMNLDPDHWGQGIGRVLLRGVTERLISMGFEEAVLWVVPDNGRARALYESEGWVADGGVSTENILGVTVTDIRYRKSLVATVGAELPTGALDEGSGSSAAP
jgi:ribosomal protein S18 acetylase RimI-like enzyme